MSPRADLTLREIVGMAEARTERRGQELAYLAATQFYANGAKNVSIDKLNPYTESKKPLSSSFIEEAKDKLPESLDEDEYERRKRELLEEINS